MNILLINPWITDFAAYDFWIKPMGLLYVGAFLKERRHNVRLIDCMDRFQEGAVTDNKHDNRKYNTGKFHREIIEKPECLKHVPRHYCQYGIPVELFRKLVLEGQKPDAVLVSCVMTYWYPGAFKVISLIHEMLPGVPVILGGIYAILCADHARDNSDSDVVIIESSPLKIIESVESTVGNKGNGPVVSDAFGEWPEPDWGLYDNLKTAMILTTRGCPMNCTVCASKILFNGYECCDPEDAAQSIINLAGMGIQDISFCDDALLIDTENHAVPLFRKLAASKTPVRLHSPNGLHVREITPEVARLMKKAGMVTIRLSLETASVDRAKDFSQKVSREEYKNAVDALYSAGYTPDDLGTYIIIGLPGQSMGEVFDSIEFVLDTGVKVKPALFSPVPGTVEFQRAVAAGMIKEDDDPVLHNNTLRTVDFWEEGVEGYRDFKKTLSGANEEVGKSSLFKIK
ncbi:MAG TPA: radical SAM protein [bacterium]|nr:radical SAM protein [bacterium]